MLQVSFLDVTISYLSYIPNFDLLLLLNISHLCFFLQRINDVGSMQYEVIIMIP